MIRINLLGLPKPKKGKRAAPSVPGEEMGGLGLAVIVLIVLGVTAVGNGVYYMRLKQTADKLTRDMAKADADYARLSQVKLRYQEREKQKDAYKKRVDVIDQLRANQSGPVNLLSMLGETVSRTDAVWLNSMNDDGKNISLKGTALSVHAVADLMHNLQSSGYFQQVEIKTSTQDAKVKDMQAFDFELSCQKQPVAAPPTEVAKPAAQRAKS